MSTQAKLAAVGLGLAMAVQPAVAETVNKGDTLNVQIERDLHMKVGETVRARTVYPLYVDNRLVVPAGSELVGTITSLEAVSKKARMHARLGGDFTPLHSPQIKFDHLVLPGGTDFPIETVTATGGTEVVRFQAMNATGHHPSIVKKLWADAIGREKETVRTFTAPGKKDRARRMLYSELPYHPELLTEGTQFAVEMAAPVQVPASVNPPDNKSAEKGVDSTVTLAAELVTAINSKNAVPGTKVNAIVTEPLFNKDQQIQVPQGTILKGEITQAHAAGKWGKGGVLRFSFRELQFPAGFVQKVHGAPVAVDSAQNANLQIDAEGGVKPGPKGIAAPLAMGLLAASALRETDEASFMHTGGASNGFALIGRVAALAAKSPYVGAAFGFYGTGRAVYGRFIGHGDDVAFPRHTRIEVVLDPERVNALKPATAK